jgi:peptidoglycan hydrolase-like protein with peptidoglycan-binding domain
MKTQRQSAQDQQNQQSARNERAISPNNLSQGEIRQVQQALDKDGFNAGRADGRWGPRTQDAVKQFQQSKQVQANGTLDQQTVADLGLDTSKFSQSQQK